MKKIKKIVALLLVSFMIFSFSGCSLLKLNKEKARDLVVAKIGEEKIKKGQIDDTISYLEMFYTVYGYELISEDNPISEVKKQVLSSFVEYYTFKDDENYPVDLDKDKAHDHEQEVKESIDILKEYYNTGDEKGFEKELAKYNLTEKTLKSIISEYSYVSEYMGEFITMFNEKNIGGKHSTKAVINVNGEDVPAYIFYYYMIQKDMQYSVFNQEAPSTSKEIKQVKKEILEQIAENEALIQEGKKQKIKISDEELNAQILNTGVDNYYGLDGAFNLAANYYISEEQYSDAVTWAAKASVYKTKLLESTSDASVSDAEIEEYFEKHKSEYDKSTVSAMHILFESEDQANKVYKEIKSGKLTFEEAIKKYSNTDGVSQASDLGAFTEEEMVEEFSSKAFSMKVGEVSEPTKSSYGYHLIYVYDKDDNKDAQLADYYSTIKSTIQSEKANEISEKYVSKLVKKAKIKDKVIPENVYDAYKEKREKELKVKVYEDRVTIE